MCPRQSPKIRRHSPKNLLQCCPCDWRPHRNNVAPMVASWIPNQVLLLLDSWVHHHVQSPPVSGPDQFLRTPPGVHPPSASMLAVRHRVPQRMHVDWALSAVTGKKWKARKGKREKNLTQKTKADEAQNITILESCWYSSYKSRMSISSVRWRFWKNVGVWNVAFSPLINFTSRNSRNVVGFWNSGGSGSVGPNGGTVSSQYMDNLYVLRRFVTTAKISVHYHMFRKIQYNTRVTFISNRVEDEPF